ncbi:MAG: rhodanese-like domain-containing protein [Acidobacteria bacterium]|nr:rhodanese-like domain-containing protein [Acidobacteriota bacterium]
MKTIHLFIGVSMLMMLLLLGVGCATSTQSASKDTQLPLSPTPAQAASPASQQDHDHAAEDGVARIKPAEALRLVTAGEAILVDVRDTGSYENMHAKGAINVTYQSITEGKFDKLPKNKHLIFYCT